MESSEEKNEITKSIEVAIMNAKSVKQMLEKVEEEEEGEEHDPRIVAFSKTQHIISIEDTLFSNDKKEKEKLYSKGDDKTQQKVRDSD